MQDKQETRHYDEWNSILEGQQVNPKTRRGDRNWCVIM